MKHIEGLEGVVFNCSMEKIRQFVEDNLELFKLNEEHTCFVELGNNEIIIRGDEDLKIVEVNEIVFINN